jgi:hypothetical protein
MKAILSGLIAFNAVVLVLNALAGNGVGAILNGLAIASLAFVLASTANHENEQ